MSEAKKGKPSPMKGRKMSELFCEKNRELQLKKYADGYVSPLIGRKRSDETKKKLSESRKGKHYPKLSEAKKGKPNLKIRKKVLQFTKDGEFVREWECITDAQKEYNLSNGSIAAVCNGKLKTTGGYKWKYA